MGAVGVLKTARGHSGIVRGNEMLKNVLIAVAVAAVVSGGVVYANNKYPAVRKTLGGA